LKQTMKTKNQKPVGTALLPCSEYLMKDLLIGRLLGGLASIALCFASLPAEAGMIAGDGFNYVPSGTGLDGANGGSVVPGAPGWTFSWSADATARVGAGLTYSAYGGLGIGNGATLGDIDTSASISRGLGDSSSSSTVWMRMLYNPGAEVEESINTATPFQLQAANSASVLNVQRTVGAGGGTGDESFTLNMTGDGTWGGTVTDTATFDLIGSGTHMLLWKLTIDQSLDHNETLSMWLDPTATTEGGLGGAYRTVIANILEGGDDYFALFSASGLGDRIDELVIGTSLDEAISPLNDPVTAVPEPSASVIMLMVGLPAVGVAWYRRRQSARA
jgi:hypothetical protein